MEFRIPCIFTNILIRIPSTGNKGNISPNILTVHKVYLGYRKIYFSGKYTTIEAFRGGDKAGKSRKHAENLET